MSLITATITGINTHNVDAVQERLNYLQDGLGAEAITQDLCDVTLVYQYEKGMLEDELNELNPTEEYEALHEFLHEMAVMPMMLGVQVTILNNHDHVLQE